MKHYNGANVWGRLREFTRKTTSGGKHYVDVIIDCASGKYGNVHAFGRLWGEAAVDRFMEAFRPGARVCMRGNLAQYTGKKDALRTNFNFYKAEAWDPAGSKHTHRRATFVIVGAVLSFEDLGDEGRLRVSVAREKREAEEFVLYTSSRLTFDIEEGGLYLLKGCLAQEDDEWGQVVKPARPVVFLAEEKKDASTPLSPPSERGEEETQGDIPF